MSHVPFVHLHNRSAYSLLSSAFHVDDIARLAFKGNMPAVALTDRMNLHACMRFYDACLKNGVRPIIGSEIAVEPVLQELNVDPGSPVTYDIVILAEDNKGYENLCELLTRIHLSSPGNTLYAKREWITELAGHWIILSGGFEGEIFQAMLADNEQGARQVAAWYSQIAGPGKFYIELQWHKLPEEKIVLPKMIDLARKINIPVVAANQCLYASKEDAAALELLRHIQRGATVNSLSELSPVSDLFHFRSYEEMSKIFCNAPEAIENTKVIADQCSVELQVNIDYITPHFDAPDGKTNSLYIEELCRQGLLDRYPDWDNESADVEVKLTKSKRKEIEKRLKFELETIRHMGFVNYFLIVADFVAFARKNNIPVGPGRGSAAGSLVSYLLDITDVDPLDFGLLFERFLNPARKKMPDIDMDFCERRRGEVIDYVRNKYGDDKVAQIATFSTMRYKAAVRETGRILNVPQKKSEQICIILSEFVREHEYKRQKIIQQAMERHTHLRELYLHDKAAKELLDLAVKIEGLPRNLSTHAAGVVISPKPLRKIVPLCLGSSGDAITQFDMYAVEKVGLLKMDFLGLTTLTLIHNAISIIKETTGNDINLSKLPLNDKLTYELLKKGDVLGVFQLETSSGMRKLVQDLQPDKFDDLIALLALYRPGAMTERAHYVDRRNGREDISYPHPKLKTILNNTYGIMLYQEQVMQVLHSLAGYSLSGADFFRQIMSKKLTKHVEKERAKFISGAEKKGIEHDLANDLFDSVAKFAGYGFNKSHATAYAFIAYWTAWLKAHFPACFYIALLNSRIDTPERFTECYLSCKSNGSDILQPDINKSQSLFSIELIGDNKTPVIRYGLSAIRNIGPAAAESILNERNQNGDFKNIDDLTRRINHRVVNRNVLESLVKAGGCDCFNIPRQRMCLIVDDAASSWDKSGNSELQRSFFDTFDDSERQLDKTRLRLDKIDEWDNLTKLSFEKELTGLYLTGHPLDSYAATWRALVNNDSRKMGYISNYESNTSADFISSQNIPRKIMGGLITKIDWRLSKKQKPYGIAVIEDYYGTFDALIWSDFVEEYRPKLVKDDVWFVTGDLKTSFGKTALSVNDLLPANEAVINLAHQMHINVFQKSDYKSKLELLSELIKNYPGNIPIELHIVLNNKRLSVVRLPDNMSVTPSEDLLRSIEKLFGADSIRII